MFELAGEHQASAQQGEKKKDGRKNGRSSAGSHRIGDEVLRVSEH